MNLQFYRYYDARTGFEMAARLVSRDNVEVQCTYCFQTETQSGPAGRLTFKAVGATERRGCRKSALLLLTAAL